MLEEKSIRAKQMRFCYFFNAEQMQNDCIYLKLNTSVRDKICFYARFCTRRIRYESSINLSLLIVFDGNAQDNVALWGHMQVKDNTKYVEVSAGQEN